MTVPNLSLKCPCENPQDETTGEPCRFTECLNSSSVELTLSGFQAFGWQSRIPTLSENGQTSYPQTLTGIDGTFTLNHYDRLNATVLEKNIASRLFSLRTTDGGCHIYVGMPEQLHFHTMRTNPNATGSATPQHTTIAMFPIAGYILGGDFGSAVGRVNELIVQLGCITILDTREPFPYSQMTVSEYLTLWETLRNTPTDQLPGWAVRRAPKIQLPVAFRLPVESMAGSDVFPLSGLPGGSWVLDGRYACALRVSPTLAGVLPHWSGELIYSTTLDYGAAPRPTGMPREPIDPFINGQWDLDNPQLPGETAEAYRARKEAAIQAFAELYRQYQQAKEAFLERLRAWETTNNFSWQDWQNNLELDSTGKLNSGTFYGIYSDSCAPRSGTKPTVYPRSAAFSLHLAGCTNLGEMPEAPPTPIPPATALEPSAWKLHRTPVYGNQYGGEYPPYIVDPDWPPPDPDPDPDQPEGNKWYLGFANHWYFTSLEHFDMDMGTGDLFYTHSEIRGAWCYQTDIAVWYDADPTNPPSGVSASECRPYTTTDSTVNPTIGPVPTLLPENTFFATRANAQAYAESAGIRSEVTTFTNTATGASANVGLGEVHDLHCGKYQVDTPATIYAEFTGDVALIRTRIRLGNCLLGECDPECW